MKHRFCEYKWLIIFSIFVIIFTSIPYWLGFYNENDLFKFSGFIIGVGDGNSYLAKMMIGTSGDWLFTTPYTAYPQMKFFAFFPYILLGKLTSHPSQTIQLIGLFHLFRWAGIIFLIFETYQFSLLVVKDRRSSLLITILLIFGGGLGWLAIIVPGLISHRLPLEFYSPETFGYLSVFSLPHLLFARAFLYKSFRTLLMVDTESGYSQKSLLKSGFSLFLCGIFQPINLFIGWFVVGIYFLFKMIKEKNVTFYIKYFIFWIIPSAPLFFYNFFSFLFDPYLSAWQDQNRIISPPIIDYLFAYGLGLFFWILIYKKGLMQKINHSLFINLWIILIPVLAYFPINIQRRLTEGVWLAFCIYIGIFIVNNKNSIVKILTFTSVILSTLIFSVGSFQAIQKVEPPIYSSKSIIDVGNYLRTEVNVGDVILAPFDESNVLPVYIPIKVITGHGPESKNLSVISENLDRFYNGDLSKAETQDFIQSFDIKFIVVPGDIDPSKVMSQFTLLQIKAVYENIDYLVLKIYDK
ncbi:MAG: hypothetical protein K0B14_04135 [Anaerolineaceae bacterium]|nr:hypothetical protein [Anaerolineaceae bacterium]